MSTATGSIRLANGNFSIATADHRDDLFLGYPNITRTSIFGRSSDSTGIASIFGYSNQSKGNNNIISGTQNHVEGDNNIVLGTELKVVGDNKVVLGSIDVSMLQKKVEFLERLVAALWYHPCGPEAYEAKQRFESKEKDYVPEVDLITQVLADDVKPLETTFEEYCKGVIHLPTNQETSSSELDSL